MNRCKHAYLIIAHDNFYTLERLIELIDDVNNDIYVHIDIKSKRIDKERLKSIVKKSNLYFTKRYNVNWGAYSMIKAEILLLNEAYKKQTYQYYHILSGVDLPIKTSKQILEFFEQNKGKEFIHFAGKKIEETHQITNRMNKYYLFQGYQRNDNKYIRCITNKIRSIALKIQNRMKIDRLKNCNVKLAHGANWCSITNDFVKYILENKKKYLPMFKYTYCADELFVQTICINSPYKDNLYYNKMDDNYIACMRYIDWNRGQPYTFRITDFDELINSKFLFARKFNENLDKDIINKLYEYFRKTKE